ncbi:MAG: DNA replication/repair protein RecF [Mycoplasmatales bacterium]
MKITQLQIKNIRNISEMKIDFNQQNSVLIGKNGAGKTTIVEAIYYCCFFTSFRTNYPKELIKFEESFLTIELDFVNEKSVENKLVVGISDKAKRFILNKQAFNTRMELLGQLSVILLDPISINLVDGGPKVRRRFLDMYIAQVDSNYLKLLTEYTKIVKQRNLLLKNPDSDLDFLEIITTKYDFLIEKIRLRRLTFLEETVIFANNVVHLLSIGTEKLTVNYKETDKVNLKIEQKNRRSMYGIQFDDFNLLINDFEVKNFGSQGQKRTVAIAMILSQMEVVYQQKKEYPIIVIDDVHLELDEERQATLFELITKKAQIIYATTDVNKLPEKVIKNSQIFSIEKGEKKQL